MRGEKRGFGVKSTGVQVLQDEEVLETGCTRRMHRTLNYTLENGEDGKFYVRCILQLKNKTQQNLKLFSHRGDLFFYLQQVGAGYGCALFLWLESIRRRLPLLLIPGTAGLQV